MQTLNALRWLLISKYGRILEKNSYAVSGFPNFRGYNSITEVIGEYVEAEDEDKNTIISEITEALNANEITDVREIDITDYYNISLNYANRIIIELGTSADVEYKIKFAKTLIEDKIGENQRGTIALYSEGGATFREKTTSSPLKKHTRNVCARKISLNKS